MSIRSWSIRAKIFLLVVPPVLALIGFWLIGTTLSAASSINLLNAKTAEAAIVAPGRALISELQEERRISAVVLAGQRERAADLREQRNRTDAAVATFRRLAAGPEAGGAITDYAAQRVDDTLLTLDSLAGVRTAVDGGASDRAPMMAGYSTAIAAVFQAFYPLSELDDPESGRMSRTVSALGYLREVLAQEDALVAAAATAGRFTAGDHSQFAQTVGAQRGFLTLAPIELSEADRTAYRTLTEGQEFSRLRALEDRLITEARPGAALPFVLDEWLAGYRPASDALRGFEDTVARSLAAREDTVAVTYYWRLGVTGVAGLLAIFFSLLVAVRVGRSLVRRLGGLRGSALEIAYHRLPDVVRRLRRGEEVPTTDTTTALEFGGDEIGQVAHAFNDVQRTAVESAVQEATLRKGLNEVFLNIARRSQTLLHRQLTLLDRMERRTTDPDELEDLFRVDHLATRMRRHAEDLVILAGAVPGRGWRQPVPLVDVIRGAVSEVEDYARVKILGVPDAALSGRAVTDVIHLLAELLENATSYSPPHTRVQVTGELVPNGFAVEIEDRGLGMTLDEIERANARLRHPPDFDPANSARLGLFVVALLAARLGVRVTLRQSPYGGVAAVVLIPPDLVEEAPPLAVGHRPEVERLPQPVTRVAVPGQRAIGAPPVVDLAFTGVARHRPGHPPAPPGPPTAPPPAPPPAPPAPPAVPPVVAPPAPPPVTAFPDTVMATVPLTAAPPAPATGELTDDGLPRRIRRHGRTGNDPSTVEGETLEGQVTQPLPARPPEETRAMMSAFQAGLARGRQDAETQSRQDGEA